MHPEHAVLWCIASAFIDYFQMGETTCQRCVSKFPCGLVNSHILPKVYLRKPTKSNACNVTQLHNHAHKIPGMLGSLEMTKVYWKNCRIHLKGQFQGQEKYAASNLKSVVDTNLWFWHAVVGFPGTLNDLNIWQRLALFESMTNGDHKKIDHDFIVNGQVFSKLCDIVDGIYPPKHTF